MIANTIAVQPQSRASSKTAGRCLFQFASVGLILVCIAGCNSQPPASESVAASVAAQRALDPQPGAASLEDSLVSDSGNGGYDVQRYDLQLGYDLEGNSIDAEVEIAAIATQDLSQFNLDLFGLTVVSVSVDGQAATFEREGQELTITPGAPLANGVPFTTVVAYGGVPLGVRDPSVPGDSLIGWTETNGEVYVVSEPNGAMNFMPCNDHPQDKALISMELSVPEPLLAVAGGRLVEETVVDGVRTTRWESRDPMATYLITIGIAEFERQELEPVHGVPIVNYFAPGTTERERSAFAETGEVLGHLIDIAGPYPFESAGGVLAGMDLPGALECQTLAVYGRRTGSRSTIAHELAHQWFGNSVSLRNWSDMWLNEGFAAYLSWLVAERIEGPENLAEQVYRAYATVRSIPNADPPGAIQSESMFGVGVYVRGPLVLHRLREEVGDDTFFSILQGWAADHRDGNVGLEDFIAYAEAAGGPAVRPLLEAWLFDVEVPRVPAFDERMAEEAAAREQRRLEREQRKAEREAKREAEEEENDG